MRRLRRFLTLSSADRMLLLRAAGALAAMRVALWALSLRKVQKLIGRAAGRPLLPDVHRRSAERIAWAVQTAARYVPGATCLPQALTTHLMLLRNGHCAHVRIGVTITDERCLQGHAWVEAEGGRVVAGGDVTRYLALGPGSEGGRRPG